MSLNILSTKKLNNGLEMPLFGLGVFRSQDGEETYNAVRWALDAGYRHIDTAAVYRNEESVGRAIRDSGVPREEIWVTTKLWNTAMRDGTQREALDSSLKLLDIGYIDLYLLHWAVQGKYKESWKILEEIYNDGSGRVRAIGVSNFHVHHLVDLKADATIIPAVNQVECHPELVQEPLVQYCNSLGIAFESWSPLGGGKLINNELCKGIGEKYNKSAPQVIIRWGLQRDIITIPKSVNQARIKQNADIFDFELTADEMALISGLDRHARTLGDPDNVTF